MKNTKAVLKIIWMMVLFLSILSVEAFALPGIERLAGSDRYSTAIEVSKAGWSNGSSEYAIIATGEDFFDALCASPLAKKFNAPVLLNGYSHLDSRVESELERLGVKNIYIVGGYSVISDTVENDIKANGIKCTRIFGSDRYETPIEIAKSLGNFNEVVVVSDSNFPDALSIAPIAAKRGMPILLSPKEELPASVREFLKDKKISASYIAGGTEAISNIAAQSLPNAKRLSGQDRYETNITILNEFSTDLDFSLCYIATGRNYPDALSASALASVSSSPVILVDSTPVATTKNLVALKLQSISELKVLGGESVISDATVKELLSIDTDDKYNDFSLRSNANFKAKVYNNVCWVPANTLGKPKLTRDQILNLTKSPEILKKEISTVYDAIQYIRSADFKGAEDSIYIEENGYNWEFHKPGSMAIVANEGNNSTMAGLVNYLLKDDYEEVGFIECFQEDGASYILNYMKHNGKYYIVDFTHYRNDFRYTAVESGNLSDYYASDFISGNIHEVSSLEDYVAYCRAKYTNPPELYAAYVSDNTIPSAVKKVNNTLFINYPLSKKDKIKKLYDPSGDFITFDFIEGPVRFPSWT